LEWGKPEEEARVAALVDWGLIGAAARVWSGPNARDGRDPQCSRHGRKAGSEALPLGLEARKGSRVRWKGGRGGCAPLS
jgi:hypothetical protein